MAKKIAKICGRIILIIFGIVALFLLTITIINQIALRADRSKLEAAYGQSVEVFGKNMQVEITGGGESVIVILPGMGIPSPIMYNKPLASFLGEAYTVVTVEPFGYGFSDPADSPRTVENIAEELHEALRKLGYDQYVLMPHSLSGLAVLYYANKYPGEVKAVAALDTTVPGPWLIPPELTPDESEAIDKEALQTIKRDIGKEKLLSNLGLRRFASKYLGDPFWHDELEGGSIANGYKFTQEDVELYRIFDLYSHNKRLDSFLLEVLSVQENTDKVAGLTFPDSIPIIYFLAQETEDDYMSGGRSWVAMHETLIGDKERSRTVILEGGHMVILTHPKEIAEEFNAWYQGLK